MLLSFYNNMSNAVYVTGTQCTTTTGFLLVWGSVPDAQTPGWSGVPDTQTPNWTGVNDGAPTTWAEIAA